MALTVRSVKYSQCYPGGHVVCGDVADAGPAARAAAATETSRQHTRLSQATQVATVKLNEEAASHI